MNNIDKAFENIKRLQDEGKFDEAKTELFNLLYYIEHKEEIDKKVGGDSVDV